MEILTQKKETGLNGSIGGTKGGKEWIMEYYNIVMDMRDLICIKPYLPFNVLNYCWKLFSSKFDIVIHQNINCKCWFCSHGWSKNSNVSDYLPNQLFSYKIFGKHPHLKGVMLGMWKIDILSSLVYGRPHNLSKYKVDVTPIIWI